MQSPVNDELETIWTSTQYSNPLGIYGVSLELLRKASYTCMGCLGSGMWLPKRVGGAKDRCTGWLSQALILFV